MLLFVTLSALAGAAVGLVTARLLPSPFDALSVLGLLVAAVGPWLLGLHGVPQGLYSGAAAVFLAMALRQGQEYLVAASDALVRQIVRGAAGGRVPRL